MVLNADLFGQYFDYQAYRKSLEPVLKRSDFDKLPKQIWENGMPEVLSTLWLRVSVSNRDRYLPFKTRWISHIPAMEQVAYLFPLHTYNALLAAHHLPELRYDPENLGRGNFQTARILNAPTYPRKAMETYAACIRKEVAATGLSGLPAISEARCPKPDLSSFPTIDLQAKEMVNWDSLNHDRKNQLWIPCHRLPRSDALRGSLCPSWAPKRKQTALFVPWDVTDYGNAFSTLRAYAQNPQNLSEMVENLLAVRTSDKRHALNIHPTYQDALNRFNLLSDLLATLTPAFALVFMLLLIAVLVAQVGTLVDHRRNQYGILISRGFTWTSIHLMIQFQMIMSIAIAAGLVLLGFMPVLCHFIDLEFQKVILDYRNLLPPGDMLEILPLEPLTVGITVGSVVVWIIGVTLLLTFRMPMRWNTTPSDLLHAGPGGPEESYDKERKKKATRKS